MDILKKIWNFLSMLPAFTNLFKRAASTGKIDPLETLDALSSISPSTKKVAQTAIDEATHGGTVADVANAIQNIGEVEVAGKTLNMKTLVPDLKRVGGICGMLAGLLENMQKQDPKTIIDFGNAAGEISNWAEVVKNVKN